MKTALRRVTRRSVLRLVLCTVTVATAVVAFGVGYTIGSEYINTIVRGSWAYTAWMPTLPWIGTGRALLTQWMVLPASALCRPRRAAMIGRNIDHV
jgi:hypothetical protein